MQKRKSSYFVEWASEHIHSSICDVPPEGSDLHGTYLANSTALQQIFKTIGEHFSAMFKRKAFLHWYTREGMEEMELAEAESAMQDLISEHQMYQDWTSEFEEEYDDDY